MTDGLDMVFVARLQFAFTVAFHIIFPSFTIGLASYLAMLEGLWLKTRRDVYLKLYRFWVKIFAVSFGMGVVSGLVMSYQFGTNWSVFSELTGNVLGPLLGYEVLTAFFLVYVPFSKISHYLYYPFTRYYFGKSMGHRGVFPMRRVR
jgi:cytochrome d ubiquinol oxidase subunit I